MTIFNNLFGSRSSPNVDVHKDSGKISSNKVSEANKEIGTWGQYVAASVTYLGHGYDYVLRKNNNSTVLVGDNGKINDDEVGKANEGIGTWRQYANAPMTYLGHSYGYLFNRINSSAAIDNDGKISASEVDEANKGIETWRQYVVAPVTYLGHSYGYLFNRASSSAAVDKDTDRSIANEIVDANRGISATILVPWRQYVVAPATYLSSSTKFAVIDRYKKMWLFRLDKAHVRGAKYPHINVNHALTGVPDPHTPISGALVTASGPVGKVMRNAGDIVTIAAVTADIYRIGSTAYTEQKESGGVGAETAKVAAGVGGAWTGGFFCAAVGGKMGSMAGGALAGPVGAGVGGIVGAVAGGIGGSIKGRSGCEHLVEQQTQAKCKL